MVAFDLRPSSNHRELNRLICRAISNPGFANRLVSAPEAVLAAGEHQLSVDEQALVRSIRAADIHDFAAQLYTSIAVDPGQR